MIWIPFAGAVSEAAGTILEKKILKRKKIEPKSYLVFAFFTITVAMIPFLFFFWRIDSPAFEFRNIVIFLFVIGTSIVANLLIYYALKWEKIQEIEPVRLLQPLFIILLAFIFYDTERNYSILIAGIIASAGLVFSHIRKHHLRFNKYLLAALLGSLLFALELVASKEILPYYSGITFYFLRCLFVFVISILILRWDLKTIDNKSKIWIFITGAIWVFYRLLLYYGYLQYGVIFTTVLFILAPVFIYIFARIFLKEKLTWRNLIATAIIILCVAYSISVGL